MSLREIITKAAAGNGGLAAYTVLSVQTDPYRLDTTSGHRDGAWLAEQMATLGIQRRIHLRGLHYGLVAAANVVKPNGKPYRNNDKDWTWLQKEAAKAARWLGYVPFYQIVDARNEPPVIRIRPQYQPMLTASPKLSIASFKVPELDDLTPEPDIQGVAGEQLYRLCLFGEKTSLAEVLEPISRIYNADLYLPSGEISDSQIWQMAQAGAEDGRPLRVFALTDCDPTGAEMAANIAHKLRALRDLHFPHLDFEVRAVALTVEQVRDLGLPSTPLKDTERRADRWRSATGVEQTEVDGLATLRSGTLSKIVRTALDPFFDHSLEERVQTAQDEWLDEARETINEAVHQGRLEELIGRAHDLRKQIAPELTIINREISQEVDSFEFDLPEFVTPEPELEGEPSAAPLVSSLWSFERHVAALRARKAYEFDDLRPEVRR